MGNRASGGQKAHVFRWRHPRPSHIRLQYLKLRWPRLQTLIPETAWNTEIPFQENRTYTHLWIVYERLQIGKTGRDILDAFSRGNSDQGPSLDRKGCAATWKVTLHSLNESWWNFPGGPMVKTSPSNAEETWVWSLGREDPVEEGITIHSSILALRILRTEDPGALQSMGLQSIRHEWVNNTSTARGLLCRP